MSSFDDLVSLIRPPKSIPGGFGSDAEGQTVKRFLERMRGGWLFELVIRAAAQYYGVERARYVLDEDVAKDVELRIEGLARVVTRDLNDADEIAYLAREELDRRVRGGFLSQIARNVLRERLPGRELRGAARNAEIIAHATEALDGQVNAMQWLQEPNRSLGGRSPLAVLTEDTPEAAELVDELLYGIEYGMFA
jgi:putative toxin-antitoxin system antitoxin component (TIGR02293 family)